MKSMLFVATVGLLLSPLAFADTLNITSIIEGVHPAVKMTAVSNNAFNPGENKIVFKAFGKVCTLNSSGNPYNAGAGAGCNYTVTIDISTQMMSLTSNGKGCTTAEEFKNACK